MWTRRSGKLRTDYLKKKKTFTPDVPESFLVYSTKLIHICIYPRNRCYGNRIHFYKNTKCCFRSFRRRDAFYQSGVKHNYNYKFAQLINVNGTAVVARYPAACAANHTVAKFIATIYTYTRTPTLITRPCDAGTLRTAM